MGLRHVQNKPDESLRASEDIDFVVRGEIDYAVKEFAEGKPLTDILGISFRQNGQIVHNGQRPQLHTEELDSLPYAVDVYKANVDIEKYTVPFLLHPFVSIYTTAYLRLALSPVAADDFRPRLARALRSERRARNPARPRALSKDEGIFL